MVLEFFKRLFKMKLQSVESGLKAKGMGAQAKAKIKAAGAVDKALKSVQKATKVDKIKEKGKEKMGLFTKKKVIKKKVEKEQPATAASPVGAGGDGLKTMAFSVSDLGQLEQKSIVGWIVVMNGAQKGQDFRLYPGKNTIGTSVDCDIVLTDPYLSTKHATIRYEDGQFVIVDLDSTNGTFVNGKRVQKAELIDNDMIKLGKTELKFKSLY